MDKLNEICKNYGLTDNDIKELKIVTRDELSKMSKNLIKDTKIQIFKENIKRIFELIYAAHINCKNSEMVLLIYIHNNGEIKYSKEFIDDLKNTIINFFKDLNFDIERAENVNNINEIIKISWKYKLPDTLYLKYLVEDG